MAAEGSFHQQLIAMGYIDECGNRYVRGGRAIDLLVPAAAKPGKLDIGDRAFDGAPGLRLALALPPIRVAVTARLTTGEYVEFEVFVPDVEAAFVLKILARTVREEKRDLDDVATLLEIVEAQPQYVASGWHMLDPAKVKVGERCDAARMATKIVATPRLAPARTRALLRRHVVASTR